MKASGETKLLLILGLLVLIGVGALFGLDKIMPGGIGPEPKPTPPPSLEITGSVYEPMVNTARHVKEDPGAQVTVVEFADFECGSCRRTYQGPLKSLLNNPKRPVKFVFRHFPLESEHKFAKPAAVASEAAAKQGKFWEMYAALFDRDESQIFDQDFILSAATKAGLDMKKFDTDMKDPELLKLVEADRNMAETNQVSYTPTFLIRDKTGKIVSAVGPDGLNKEMDAIFGSEAGGSPAGLSPAPKAP